MRWPSLLTNLKRMVPHEKRLRPELGSGRLFSGSLNSPEWIVKRAQHKGMPSVGNNLPRDPQGDTKLDCELPRCNLPLFPTVWCGVINTRWSKQETGPRTRRASATLEQEGDERPSLHLAIQPPSKPNTVLHPGESGVGFTLRKLQSQYVHVPTEELHSGNTSYNAAESLGSTPVTQVPLTVILK